MRLDAFVAQEYPERSRSTWQKLIESGNVQVNGHVQASVKHNVDESDVVTVDQLEQPNFDGHTLPVVYEDDNVIVIDKPVGVLTHSKGALNDEFTVAEFVRPLTSYKSDTNRPGIIHRLDRDTSGIIICAKNDSTASMLQRQFSERKTKKVYIAVLERGPKEPKAVLRLPIGRNPNAPSTFRVDSNGKDAETTYQVLRDQVNGTSLVELRPRTGRTHQLRVHMAYIHTPILGDKVYGTVKADRMYLHAHTLEITLPGGDRQVFTSPVPAVFDEKVA